MFPANPVIEEPQPKRLREHITDLAAETGVPAGARTAAADRTYHSRHTRANVVRCGTRTSRSGNTSGTYWWTNRSRDAMLAPLVHRPDRLLHLGAYRPAATRRSNPTALDQSGRPQLAVGRRHPAQGSLAHPDHPSCRAASLSKSPSLTAFARRRSVEVVFAGS